MLWPGFELRVAWRFLREGGMQTVLIVVGVLATDGLVFSVVASLSVAFVFTFTLTVVCVSLSHLASSAADIKSENDLVV